MYEQFFNLKETPFSIAPNPHYLYMSRQHHEALAHLVYGVGRDGGFVLLTGEVGTGKTTVCRCFLEQIPDDTDVAFILNPKMNVEELLATICDELSIPYIDDSVSIKDYVDCINVFLLRQHANGRHTVLIIDEAQNLGADVLEQLRLLTNLETHEKKLLQIVLLGQPELQEMFRQPELRQLSQRVTARFHLDAMQPEEVGPYVYHRLAVAGATEPRSIYPATTIARLYQISKGIPRVINLVCDRAMLGAYANETRIVNPNILNKAATEVLGAGEWSVTGKRSLNPWIASSSVAALLVVLFGAFTWHWFSTQPGKAPISVAQANAAPSSDSLAAPVALDTSSDISLPIEPLAPLLPTFGQVAMQSHYQTEGDAYADLFGTWGVQYNPQANGAACNFADSVSLACLSRAGNLGSVRHFGVPAILRLYTQEGERFLVLKSLSDAAATVILNGTETEVSLGDIDQYWRGQFSLLWKKPPSYHAPLQPGSIAPLSKWLSYQLDVWEKKPNPEMGRSIYDEMMVERVRSFQRQVGEQDDGVVGVGTLIQLSRRVDETVPVLQPDRGGS